MENNDEREIFELSHFERWGFDELEKATRQFRKHFFKIKLCNSI